MKKNKTTKRIIIAGFLLVYLFCMFLTTYLTVENIESNLYRDLKNHLTNVKTQLEDKNFIFDENGELSREGIDYMTSVLTKETRNASGHTMISLAISDEEGNLIAKSETGILIGDIYEGGRTRYYVADLKDYLSEEEMGELISIYASESNRNQQNKRLETSCYYDYETNELIMLFVKEIETIDVETGNNSKSGVILTYSNEVGSETIFDWRNQEYLKKNTKIRKYYNEYVSIYFPYLYDGLDSWEEWTDSSYLQEFYEGTTTYDLYSQNVTMPKKNFEITEDTDLDYIVFSDQAYHLSNGLVTEDGTAEYNYQYRIQLNATSNLWLETLDELKEIYIYTACFAIICLAIILFFTDKINKKQLQLETTRRDFTNAIAHELKTPLSVVRSLAENIEEEESADTRTYFTQSIVNQTERMDGLIQEMLFISKMDSDEVKLKMEEVSFLNLIKDQITKLEYLIEGKNLQILYEGDEDCIVKGDKSYLEKAAFNLLENAVSYNNMDGKIIVKTEKKGFSIENSALPIPEEDLPHLCDMFFTGNKSRSSDTKHTGLGLYLAKRIFDMHRMELKIVNSEIGVKVTVIK